MQELAQSFGEEPEPQEFQFVRRQGQAVLGRYPGRPGFQRVERNRGLSGIFHAGISGCSSGRMGRAVDPMSWMPAPMSWSRLRFDWGDTAGPELVRRGDRLLDGRRLRSALADPRSRELGGPALVIGSTGFSDEQDAAHPLKAAEKIAIVKQRQLSRWVVNILIGLVEHAAQRLEARDWDIEVIEAHHRRLSWMRPSGTALMLGEAAANGPQRRAFRASAPNPMTAMHGRATESGTIGFSSIRAGGIVGDHTVLFGSELTRP